MDVWATIRLYEMAKIISDRVHYLNIAAFTCQWLSFCPAPALVPKALNHFKNQLDREALGTK